MKTNVLLPISAGLNAVLMGACWYLLSAQAPVATDVPSNNGGSPVTTKSSPASVAITSPATVHWMEQVEADDYPTYIANLRAIGMPETTLRQIVTAEVTEQYAQRQKQVAANSKSQAEPQQCWEQLQAQKDTLISNLLSRPTSEIPTKAVEVSRTESTKNGGRSIAVTETFDAADSSATEGNASVIRPAVLLEPDPAIAFTTDQRVSEWEKLQDEFIEAIGGPDQNPDDPAYRARWVEAQQLSDATFKARYGTAAFILQNILAGRQKRAQ